MNAQEVGILTIESGPGQGKQLKLSPGDKIVFGRSRQSDYCIPDKTVSRAHAVFQADERGVYMKNLGTNGTVINRRRVVHHKTVLLEDRTEIEIGNCKLRLDFPDGENTVIFNPAASNPPSEDFTRVFSRDQFQPEMEKLIEKELSNAQKAAAEKAAESPAVNGEVGNPQKGFNLGVNFRQLSGKYLKTTLHKTIFGLFLALALLLAGKMFFSGERQPAEGKKPVTSSPAAYDAKFIVSIEFPLDTIAGPVPKTEIDKASIYFKTAETLFKNHELHEQNLYSAIQKWQQGIYILGKYSNGVSLDMYREAVEKNQAAVTLLSEKVADWKTKAKISYNKKDYRAAYHYVKKIMAALPDLHHPEYQWAKKNENKLKVKVK